MQHLNSEEENNKHVPELQGTAKKAGVEIYPQLFNVVGVQHGTAKIILYTRAHFTKEEAIEAFKIKAALQTGIPGELWVIKVVSSISALDLEREFLDIQNQTAAEKRKTKNALMKQILDSKDINLLHRHYGRFNNNEIEFMHERLI